MITTKAFINTLFDKDQKTCYTKHANGRFVTSYPKYNALFFCINALHPDIDFNPTEEYHAPDKPRRADHNVICFRNFLLELDNIPVDKQVELIKSRKLPITSAIFSGSKSIHFIISLEEPLNNIDEYRHFAARLHALVPEADPTTKNPSRLSRLPNVKRTDTNKMQKLLYLGKRIPFATLDALLPKVEYTTREELEQKSVQAGSRFIPLQLLEACYDPDEVMHSMDINGRNQFFFWLGQRLKELQLEQDKRKELVERAYLNLKNTSGFSISEAYSAARV
jgi:hypothetical protein